MKKPLAIGAGVLCLVVVIAMNQVSYAVESGDPALKAGDVIPKIEAASIEGLPVSFRPMKGKYNLVAFYTALDPVTDESIQDMLVLYRRFHEKGLDAVCVFLDQRDDIVAEFMERWTIPWANVLDSENDPKRPSHLFRVEKTPTNFLIDDQGTIRAVDLSGPMAHKAIAKFLNISLEDLLMPEPPKPAFERGTQLTTQNNEIALDGALLGFGINPTNQLKDVILFEPVDKVSARVLQKNGSATVSLGWYQGEKETILFKEFQAATEAKEFQPGKEKFGIYITVSFDKNYQWYTEPEKNKGNNQVKIYPAMKNGEKIDNSFILAWEDVPLGTLDDDFQDVIIRVDGVKPVRSEKKE